MNILIIGGGRFVGPILIKKLLSRNHTLTVFNRGNIQRKYDGRVTFVKGDRNSKIRIPGQFDVVIDMCAYNKSQLENVINSLTFDYFINFGTAASYKKTDIFPLTEQSEIGVWPVWGDYNLGKVECEEFLQMRKTNYATIRPVYILGESNYIERESFIYSKIIKGETIILPGNGQAICQFVFAEDVAEVLILLAEKKLQGAYNIAGDELITLQGLVKTMARIAGKKAKISYNSNTDGASHNKDEFPFANENFICSNVKLKDLGIKFSPLIKTLKLQYKNFYSKNING